jgi:methylated-DNA-protein-cysteine methyltransferase-like protein
MIARLLGAPGKAREVGWAMHVCPDDVPAHRVINRLGAVSGERHGEADSRQFLLEAEGVRFDARGRCDLAAYEWTPDADELDQTLHPDGGDDFAHQPWLDERLVISDRMDAHSA